MMTAKLPIHEWCIILLFCLVLLALAGFALHRPKPAFKTSSLPPESIATVLEVRIEGQVAKPGLYRLPLNAKLKDLLEQAQPLSSADLSQLNWRRKLRNGQLLHIPERRLITIQLAGAARQPGPLVILSGTRCCELVNQLQILPEADLNAIRKRKCFLQEGDCIEIPIKGRKKEKSASHK